MGPCLQKPIMKVPLFTQRIFLFYHTEDILFFSRRIFYFSHGVSRNITEISKQDYNSDNFSVAISEKKKIRDHPRPPCEKKKNLRVKKENP